MYFKQYVLERRDQYEFAAPHAASVTLSEAREIFPDRPWLWGGLPTEGWAGRWRVHAELWVAADDDPSDGYYPPPPQARLASIAKRELPRQLPTGTLLAFLQVGMYETGRPQEIEAITFRSPDGGRVGFELYYPYQFREPTATRILGRILPTVAIAPETYPLTQETEDLIERACRVAELAYAEVPPPAPASWLDRLLRR
jgi:hypothetical protein